MTNSGLLFYKRITLIIIGILVLVVIIVQVLVIDDKRGLLEEEDTAFVTSMGASDDPYYLMRAKKDIIKAEVLNKFNLEFDKTNIEVNRTGYFVSTKRKLSFENLTIQYQRCTADILTNKKYPGYTALGISCESKVFFTRWNQMPAHNLVEVLFFWHEWGSKLWQDKIYSMVLLEEIREELGVDRKDIHRFKNIFCLDEFIKVGGKKKSISSACED